MNLINLTEYVVHIQSLCRGQHENKILVNFLYRTLKDRAINCLGRPFKAA